MADESLTENAMDVSKLKVNDLKKELKMRGLTTSGNKNDLIERLQGALKCTDLISPDSVDDLEEDLLNDDDDEHLDASESILENELDDSPKSQKRKLEENSNKLDTATITPPPKKVILNRNISVEPTKIAVLDKGQDKKINEKNEDKPNDEKKIIKLSQLSAKERLEMRAKKFGVTAFSDDAKKLVRAERFGTSISSSTNGSSKTSTNVNVLKQRAERFGGSVSSVMSTLENQEKLEKRKARFGSTITNGIGDNDNDKAKQQRLERFKNPVK